MLSRCPKLFRFLLGSDAEADLIELELGADFADLKAMLNKFVAYQCAKDFYWKCKTIKLPPYLKDQLLRAASSVAMNLAEGSGKRTVADQRRFYGIAHGSLRECQAVLELERISDEQLLALMNRLGGMLFKLSRG